MQYNIDSCNYTNTSGNKDLTEGEVEIKKEIESKDLIPLENLIKNEQIEMIQTNIDYENFKLKNEEVDLKFECNDADLSTYECEKVDFGKEISSDKSYMNSVKEEKKHEVNDPEINDLEKSFKCTLCSKAFTRKINLDKHLLKIHKCRDVKKNLHNCDQCSYEAIERELLLHKLKHDNTNDLQVFKCHQCTFETYYKYSLKIHKCRNVRKKLYNCDQCSYECLKNSYLLRHKIKHGITDGIPVLKCYQCTYQTHRKEDLIKHVKIHQNIKDFKCTLCLKTFTWKISLDNHLLKIHKCRNIRKKLYNCDQCSYECLSKSVLLKHKIKHGITDGIPILKCHKCPKTFTQKISFNSHLLKIHKYRDVGKKIYNCDQCSYEYLTKSQLLQHKIKHGITDGIPIFKCYQCTFDTYRKANLIRHTSKY